MSVQQGPDTAPAGGVVRSGVKTLDFAEDTGFQAALRARVDDHFRLPGRRRRDCWQMYLKTAIILAAFAASYVLLVFVARTLWQGLLLAVALALFTAAIGFNIQHDGGHQAYSSRRWVNRLMAWTLDLVGSSSVRWHWKHTVIHHMYVNITGYDHDLNIGRLGRLSPHQPRRPCHRWQHLYLWVVYGLLALKLQFADDLRYLVTGRIGPHRVPRPQGRELVLLVAGKALFITWAFVVPLFRHSVWVVLFYYAVAAVILGMLMVLVFIVPHLNDKAEFPLPQPDTGRIDRPWAVHQATVTVNFARRNPVLTWLFGGLNYHKEHHLFPLICHVNYPGLSQAVEATCREFNVPYHEQRSFLSGIAAHYRWLRLLARTP